MLKPVTKNYNAVDLFKFVAALLVVAIHSKPFGENTVATYYFTCFCRIAVPFFFCFSSYIFYKKDRPIKSYVVRLIKLYACWFFIELPFIYLRFFSHGFDMESVLMFIRGILWRNTFYASWFITALWQGMLITYIMFKYLRNAHVIIITIICVLLSSASSLYSFLFPTCIQETIKLLELDCSFICAIPYCVIGRYIYIYIHDISNKSWLRPCMLLSLFTGIGEIVICKDYTINTNQFLSLFVFIPLFIVELTKIRFIKNNNCFVLLRKLSILIYLSHMPIMIIIGRYFGGYHLFIMTSILSISFACLIYFTSRKIKILKYLY